MQLLGDFFQRGISTQFTQKALIHLLIVFQSSAGFLSHTVCPGLQGDRLGHVKPDPEIPGAFIVAAIAPVHRLPEPKASLLNQIQEQDPKSCEFPGNFKRPGQAQTGQILLRLLVALGGLNRQKALFPVYRCCRQFFQIHPQRIIRLPLIRGNAVLAQLHFPKQTGRGFSCGFHPRQIRHIQPDLHGFQILESIFHCLLFFLLQ